jgi:hypothetical protein
MGINGQTVTVPEVIRDATNIGDQVKVEGVVNADGSFTVANWKSPRMPDLASV